MRANPATANFLQGVIAEIIAVAVALKVELPQDMQQLVWQQIEKSGYNSDTSMQRDVLAGKPSELDSQTGAVLRLAELSGVAVPLNQMIYASLMPQEQAARAAIN
ncbi:MAG: 2-dehydropantoate 2-reductase [Osedax symbiont Rs2]|nr:MAG: 2-dehydropantoate 2-reductase [Osedax symbiont Rs2]